jgi:hypothetical protein
VTPRSKTAALLRAALLFSALAACRREEYQGPAERAGKQIDDALRESGEKLNEAGKKVGDALGKAGDEVGKAMEDAGKKLQETPSR